jgi:hypothetical protein
MQHISEAGCKLLLDSSIEGLNLKEFFLVLSCPGLAYRRCEFEWVKGDELGLKFLRKSRTRPRGK